MPPARTRYTTRQRHFPHPASLLAPVGSVLLSCAFMYHICWVLVSKWWFRQSVMIVVARGDRSGEDGIPMPLKIPRMFDPWGGYSIIGFGDVILPGLRSFCSEPRLVGEQEAQVRILPANNVSLWSRTGLLIPYIALNVMDEHGQPALLYIVPFILAGTLVVLGHKRGELKTIWTSAEPDRRCPHALHYPTTAFPSPRIAPGSATASEIEKKVSLDGLCIPFQLFIQIFVTRYLYFGFLSYSLLLLLLLRHRPTRPRHVTFRGIKMVPTLSHLGHPVHYCLSMDC